MPTAAVWGALLLWCTCVCSAVDGADCPAVDSRSRGSFLLDGDTYPLPFSDLSSKTVVQSSTVGGNALSHHALSHDGKYQVVASFFEKTSEGSIQVSSDYGTTWTLAKSYVKAARIAMDWTGKYAVAVSTGNLAPLVSTDYGATWKAVSDPDLTSAAGGVSINSDGTVFALAMGKNVDDFPWVSTDFGATWSRVTTCPSGKWHTVELAAKAKQYMLVGGVSSVQFSKDARASFTKLRDGEVISAAMSQSGQYVLMPVNWGSSVVSADYAVNFRSTNIPFGAWEKAAMSESGQVMGVWRWSDLWVSVDYGVTWLDIMPRHAYGVALSGDGLFGLTGLVDAGDDRLLRMRMVPTHTCPDNCCACTGDANICDMCKPGFYQRLGKCIDCNTVLSGCGECVPTGDGAVCKACGQGYFNNGKEDELQCARCSDVVPGATVCALSGLTDREGKRRIACSECAETYGLTNVYLPGGASYVSCRPCGKGCGQCSGNPLSCDVCVAGFTKTWDESFGRYICFSDTPEDNKRDEMPLSMNWWAVIAGAGGGALLVAIIGIVLYCVLPRGKPVQTKTPEDAKQQRVKQVDHQKKFDFFIGHTKRSKTANTEDFIVEFLLPLLKKQGYNCFFDQVSLPGKEIERCLTSAKESYVHVVILDEMTPKADWVLQELDRSYDVGNPCVAVHRINKFNWAAVGKEFWRKTLPKSKWRLVGYVFQRPAVRYSNDQIAKEAYTNKLLEQFKEILDNRKAELEKVKKELSVPAKAEVSKPPADAKPKAAAPALAQNKIAPAVNDTAANKAPVSTAPIALSAGPAQVAVGHQTAVKAQGTTPVSGPASTARGSTVANTGAVTSNTAAVPKAKAAPQTRHHSAATYVSVAPLPGLVSDL